MVYDFDKYRERRERVLGVRKRGLSFGILAGIVAAVIVGGLAVIFIPQGINYLLTRNLDDAIYKRADATEWPSAVVAALSGVDGVHKALTDNHNTRLVVTFDRTRLKIEQLGAFFEKREIETDLLNRMGHRQRQLILQNEAEFELQ